MANLTIENSIRLILAGIRAGAKPDSIEFNIINTARDAGIDNVRGMLEEFTDSIIKFRNVIAGKVKISQLEPILKALFSATELDSEKLKGIILTASKKAGATLDSETVGAFLQLHGYLHPILIKDFFLALLDFNFSETDNTERKKATAISALAKEFGIKLPHVDAINLVKFKVLFEQNEHVGVLKAIMKNLFGADISQNSLEDVLSKQAVEMGYQFQPEHIAQFISLKRHYLDALNGSVSVPTPVKNIMQTAALASALTYQFPGMLSHMIAFQTVNSALKRVLGSRIAPWIPLTGFISSLAGYPLPHTTYINMFKDYIANFMEVYPTESMVILTSAAILYYRSDDLKALYQKAKSWVEDPFGFDDMLSEAFGEAFFALGTDNELQPSPQPLIFPRLEGSGSTVSTIDSSLTTDMESRKQLVSSSSLF